MAPLSLLAGLHMWWLTESGELVAFNCLSCSFFYRLGSIFYCDFFRSEDLFHFFIWLSTYINMSFHPYNK
ncbi:unnamed protein product [Periconia digitata]|uniref:Uncharacterized protein n=1 Tax=Periconia digitata TaxID=1303443 RepID=A0A9W4XVV2_9PLEO|nr:unnamed protein product [Periconia digitata]